MARVIGIKVLRRNADGSIECVTDPTGCCDRSGSGTLSCVTECSQCPLGISSILYIELLDAGDCTLVTAGEKVLSYQPLPNVDCRWATDYGDQWELYYDAPDDTWYLVGGDGELIYELAGNWDCDGENSFNLVSASCTGADENMTVTQDFPCAVLLDGCDRYFPLTLTANTSVGAGTCGCLDETITLTWNGTAWVGTLTGCGSGTLTVTLTPAAFVAGASSWTIGVTGGGCSFMPPQAPVSSVSCAAVNMTTTLSVVSGCCGAIDFNMVITEPA